MRSSAYGFSPHEDARGSTYARITSRGAAGRADLMSPIIPLPPCAPGRVRARIRMKEWTAVVEGDYRVTIGGGGEGYLEIDDVTVDLAGRGEKSKGTVRIVDPNDRAEDYVTPEGGGVGKEIAAIRGCDVVTWSYRDLDEKRRKRLAPVAMILSPYSGPPPGDAKARGKARLDTYPILKQTKIPTLGICLGHQWLGWSEGVETHAEGESGDALLAGKRRDPLFEGVPDLFPGSQSHEFALLRLPPGFHLLASPETTAIHAIKDQRRPAYGFRGTSSAAGKARPPTAA